ncbi:hypothetical protein [Lentzea jiangxiensis]|uniref:Major Facilitator Superfamily protein n=1 Tax=Lentzea jiangxiensis TaxID=641025 RepID=A0A1H0WIL4_9PSEU|nr:hypothetical protein [Lentzea jiangxiensis]SDP90325.1 hypothetical protein SAMN05421507_119142 [Lentzea jiangxiensis]
MSALTALTLVAGLAGTVFAPLTVVLNTHLDWRGTYLVLAGTLAVTTIPLHLFGLRLPWPEIEHEAEHRPSAVLAGVARGIFTLVQATAITDRRGAVHCGQLSGLLAVPVMFTAAIAP